MTRPPLAIVGLALRVAGANNVESFWQLLMDKRVAFTRVPKERFDIDVYYDPHVGTAPKIVSRVGGFIDHATDYDHDFFGVSSREARSLDPQQFLLLELAWTALEDAGWKRERLPKRTGVFVGCQAVDARTFAIPPFSHLDAYAATGLTLNTLANRISYHLDINGPSFTVDSACSASLTALHLACQSVWSGESEIAFAAGVAMNLAPQQPIVESLAGLLSPSDSCRPFDARADGIVRGEGGGIVILKPLARALADGDFIYAEVASTAATHNGRTQGISQTNAAAQAALMRRLLDEAGSPHVGFVEAHGTAMPGGDRVELDAITQTVTDAWITSSKANIGHLEAASGIASIIKTCLVLTHGTVPPQASFEHLPDGVSLGSNAIPTQAQRLAAPAALVNGLGLGGANAGALLRKHAAQTQSPSRNSRPSDVSGLSVAAVPQSASACLPLSAHDTTALRALAERHTLKDGAAAALHRTGLRERAVVFDGEGLSALAEGRPSPAVVRGQRQKAVKVAFVFPGHAPKWAGIHQRMPAHARVFHERLAEADALLGWSIRQALEGPLSTTDVLQPVICAVEIALADQLVHWGIVPSVVVGHSAGEAAAAYCAGVLSFSDALQLAAIRGRQMHTLAGQGAMYAVAADAVRSQQILELCDGVGIAARNSPQQTVFWALGDAGEQLEEVLSSLRVDFKRLELDYPFHSPAIDALAHTLTKDLSHLSHAAPLVPMVSSYTGALIEHIDASYWYAQTRAMVQFMPAMHATAAAGATLFIEVGPDATLAYSLKQMQLDTLQCTSSDRLLAEAWVRGVEVDWARVFGYARVPHRHLPNYPWQRRSVWTYSPYERESQGLLQPAVPVPPLYTRTWVATEVTAQEGVVVSPTTNWRALAKKSPRAKIIFKVGRGAKLSEYTRAIGKIIDTGAAWSVYWWLRDAPAFLGLARAMRLEHRDLFGGVVEADTLSQLAAVPGEHALRGKSFEEPRLTPLTRRPQSVQLRRDRTYAVTGGLGGLGFALAKRICQSGARLVILTRRKIQARRDAQVLELEALGAEVSVVSLDVSKQSALRGWLAAEKRDNRRPLHGVFHCAVMEQGEPLIELTQQSVALHRRAKVDGFKALQAVLKDVDFLVAVSSMAGLLGGVWQAAYAAANTELESLAGATKYRSACIALGPVKAGGLDARGARIDAVSALGYDPYTAEEAVEALLAATDPALPNVMWSLRGNIAKLSSQLGAPAVLSALLPPRSDTPAPASSDREQALLAIVQEVLGQPHITVEDDLFDHGATSFAIMEIISRARALNFNLSAMEVFGNANVRALAARSLRTPHVRHLTAVEPTRRQKKLLGKKPSKRIVLVALDEGLSMDDLHARIDQVARDFPDVRLHGTQAEEGWLVALQDKLSPAQYHIVKRRRQRQKEQELWQEAERIVSITHGSWVDFVLYGDGFFAPTHVAIIASPLALDGSALRRVARAFGGSEVTRQNR